MHAWCITARSGVLDGDCSFASPHLQEALHCTKWEGIVLPVRASSYESASLHAGHTAAHALADLSCILRLHTSLSCILALMRATAQTGSKSVPHQPNSSAAPLPSGTHDSAGPVPASKEPSERALGSVKRKRPSEENMTGTNEGNAKRSRHGADISINAQSHDRGQPSDDMHRSSRSPACGTAGGLSWQCQHSSPVSIANTGAVCVQLAVAPATAAANPSAGGKENDSALPVLEVTLQWSWQGQRAIPNEPKANTGSAPLLQESRVSATQRRCCVTTVPGTPASACDELAAMAGKQLHSWTSQGHAYIL